MTSPKASLSPKSLIMYASVDIKQDLTPPKISPKFATNTDLEEVDPFYKTNKSELIPHQAYEFTTPVRYDENVEDDDFPDVEAVPDETLGEETKTGSDRTPTDTTPSNASGSKNASFLSSPVKQTAIEKIIYSDGFLTDVCAFIQGQIDCYSKANLPKDEVDKEIIIQMQQMLKEQLKFFQTLLSNDGQFQKLKASEIEKTLCVFVPLSKIGKDKYYYGTEIKNISLKAGKLMVRVGGGYDEFQPVLKANAFMEVIKILN